MKAIVDKISKPSVTDGSYIVEYTIQNDDSSVEQTQLELRVEAGQSAKELLKAKVAEYESNLASVDVTIGEEV